MFFNWAIFSVDVGDEYIIRYLMLSYQFNCLFMSIIHIIMNNLVVVLLKSSKY